MYRQRAYINLKHCAFVCFSLLALFCMCKQSPTHLELAIENYNYQRYASAAELFDMVAQKGILDELNNPNMYFMAGNAHYYNKNYEQAEYYYSMILEKHSSISYGNIGMGRIYRELGDTAQAYQFMQNAYKNDTTVFTAINLAYTYLWFNKYNNAISILEKYIDDKPHDENLSTVYWLLGEAYIMKDDYQRAYNAYELYIYFRDKEVDPMIFADLAILHHLLRNEEISQSKIESALYIIPYNHKRIFEHIKSAIQSGVKHDSLIYLMLKKNKTVL